MKPQKAGGVPRAYLSMALTATKHEFGRLSSEIGAIKQVARDMGIDLYVPHEHTDPVQFASLEPADVFEASRRKILEADVLIVHSRFQSFAVGLEAGFARGAGKPCVLLLPQEGHGSRMLVGALEPQYHVRYSEIGELIADLQGALALALGLPQLQRAPLDDEPSRVVETVSSISTELVGTLAKDPTLLHQLHSRRFEELVAELLASFGWTVELTAATRDGGYDIFAIVKDPGTGLLSRWIVECKKYAPSRKVGIEIVRALYGTRAVIKGANALLATTSFFTKGAREFKASRLDLELRDYHDIVEWLRQYRPNSTGTLYIREPRAWRGSGGGTEDDT